MILEADLICPICSKKMTKLELGKTTIDVCLDGCGGIWFDNYEMKHFDNGSDYVGKILENIQPEPGIKYDPDAKRECPRCVASTLTKLYYDVNRTVLIDRCNICGGVLLDGGEITKIRSLYFTEADKKLDEEKKAAENAQKNEPLTGDPKTKCPSGFNFFMSNVVNKIM